MGPEVSKLPPHVHFKHGAFYYVKHNRWTRLCEQPEQVTAALAQVRPLPPVWAEKAGIPGEVQRLFVRARLNARGRRAIAFDLTVDDVWTMLDASAWRCAVTRTRFSLEVHSGKRPFAPSIDRIDSATGYTRKNCRIVCVATNYAMNVWGEFVLHRLLQSYRAASRASMNVSKV